MNETKNLKGDVSPLASIELLGGALKLKTFLVLLFVLFFGGCIEQAKSVRTEQTNNPELKSDLLFEKDGYKIYRFNDGGRNVYYVVPNGQAQTVYNESCGKNCFSEVRIESTTAKTK